MAQANVVLSIVFPAIGVLTCNLMYIGHMRELLALRKEGNGLASMNVLSFPFIFISSLGYTLYGLALKDPFIIGANVFGILTGLFYIFTALRLTRSTVVVRQLEWITLVLMAYWILVSALPPFLSVPASLQTELFGYSAMACTSTLYVSPLFSLLQVIRERDSSSINVGFMIGTALNTTVWTIYGFAAGPLWPVILPNFAGISVVAIQVVLCCMFPRLENERPAPDAPEGDAAILPKSASPFFPEKSSQGGEKAVEGALANV